MLEVVLARSCTPRMEGINGRCLSTDSTLVLVERVSCHLILTRTTSWTRMIFLLLSRTSRKTILCTSYPCWKDHWMVMLGRRTPKHFFLFPSFVLSVPSCLLPLHITKTVRIRLVITSLRHLPVRVILLPIWASAVIYWRLLWNRLLCLSPVFTHRLLPPKVYSYYTPLAAPL